MKGRTVFYFFIYYLVFFSVFAVIKHFVGWNAHTFEQVAGPESNFIASTITVLCEIVVALLIGVVLFLIAATKSTGKFIIWTTASVIPVAVFIVVGSYIIFGIVNDGRVAESSKQLHREIISRLPANTFKKRPGAKDDFAGYVTADNDSLGLILPDSNGMARVYIYVDSAKLGAFDFDSCTVCSGVLQKILTSIVIPMQSFSAEEVKRNIALIDSGRCYVADRSIYLSQCRKPGRRFIIINNVYDEVRGITCYEIGFQADVKTPAAPVLDLFE